MGNGPDLNTNMSQGLVDSDTDALYRNIFFGDPTAGGDNSLIGNVWNWVSGAGAKKAAAEVKATAADNMNWLKNNYASAANANTQAFGDRMESLGSFSSRLNSLLGSNLDRYGSAINSQLAGQTGVYRTSLDQILNASRSKAASSGFVGGTQEEKIMTPLVSQLTAGYTQNYADTLSGYQQSRLNTLLAATSGVESLRQAAYGQYGTQNTALASSAMSAFSSLSEAQTKAAGAHNEGAVGNIMGIIASIFGG